MEYLFIYLLQIAEIINTIAVIMIILSFFISIFLGINYLTCKYSDSNSDEYIFFKSLIKGSLVCLILSILMLFIPTKQTLLLIGGTYLGKKAVNTVITDEKIKKIDTIINLQLDKYIKELENNK